MKQRPINQSDDNLVITNEPVDLKYSRQEPRLVKYVFSLSQIIAIRLMNGESETYFKQKNIDTSSTWKSKVTLNLIKAHLIFIETLNLLTNI